MPSPIPQDLVDALFEQEFPKPDDNPRSVHNEWLQKREGAHWALRMLGEPVAWQHGEYLYHKGGYDEDFLEKEKATPLYRLPELHPQHGQAGEIDRTPAPPNSLPTWGECEVRVKNSDFLAKRRAEGGYGPEADSKLATQLHRFIYEYDDADPYRSAWFLHRLELLLEETKAHFQPSLPAGWVRVPGEPSDAMIRAGWEVGELRTPNRIYRAMLAAAPPPPKESE